MSGSGTGFDAVSIARQPPSQGLDVVLCWFRRDLRVADNPALTAALQAGKTVIPVYIWAPEEEGQFQPGRCSRWWLYSSLNALQQDLETLGTQLIMQRAPESRMAVLQLVEDTGAQAVFFNHLYDPISLVRDNEVKAALAARGCHCQSFNADVLYEPWEVLADSGQPFTSFEGFWGRAMNMPYPPPVPLPVPARLPPVPKSVVGLDLPNLGLMTPEEQLSNAQLEYTWKPGGRGAHLVLEQFVLGRLVNFDQHRAKTDRNSTSRLSPHIHYGEISVRHVYYVARQREMQFKAEGSGGTSCEDFLRQMGYREYARYLSFHFPFTHERSLLEHLRAAPWKFDQRLFKAWRQGRTGYPLVDAGMRELWSTGWLHNRTRVICASFLVKNLLLPWQWGLKHYWDALLDADLECDALGWQYCSGCLADAHPFSYMLDHKVESKRFDPDGNYVRRWLPVLARLPIKYIHSPWEAPEHILSDAGVELGVNYPFPVISVEESQQQLQHASTVIEQSMAWGHAAPAKIPYRPASLPNSRNASQPTSARESQQGQQAQHEQQGQAQQGLDPYGAPQYPHGSNSAHQQQQQPGQPQQQRLAQPYAQRPKQQFEPMQGEDSDEEVVSNTLGPSSAAPAHFQRPRHPAGGDSHMAEPEGDDAAGNDGGDAMEDAQAAVVPTMSNADLGSRGRKPHKAAPQPAASFGESVAAPQAKRQRLP
ncbi:hypothetical protein WJX72_004261 [[Myrmecia] bisecta]|uniref:Photolyase/cryptochrome alpha/beta domain-containing protein n=1 Tax=[Myrmecia] bisecta TaxID=41462 RepID=A0AAW1QES9_9CHLO